MALSDWTLYKVTFADGIKAETHALDEAMARTKAERLYVEQYPWAFGKVPAIVAIEVVR